jgi:hypothetical protein
MKMNNVLQQIFFTSFFYLLSLSLTAKTEKELQNEGFKILDRVCLIVEGQPPVLLSDIEKKMQQNSIGFEQARVELKRERLLWNYAKTQLKFDVQEIMRLANQHLKDIMNKNNLTEKKFANILMGPPHLMTLEAFRWETATMILLNHVKASLRGQISITDAQVKAAIEDEKKAITKKYQIVFISVTKDQVSKQNANKKSDKKSLEAEFKTANEIRSQINSLGSLNAVKKRYEDKKNITIIGPIDYEKGRLREIYEKKLEQDTFKQMTEPFIDDGAVTFIWKLLTVEKKLDETALEKVRKDLYDKVVMEKINTITDAMINGSTVVFKDCGK